MCVCVCVCVWRVRVARGSSSLTRAVMHPGIMVHEASTLNVSLALLALPRPRGRTPRGVRHIHEQIYIFWIILVVITVISSSHASTGVATMSRISGPPHHAQAKPCCRASCVARSHQTQSPTRHLPKLGPLR